VEANTYFSDFCFDEIGVNPIIAAYEWLINEIYVGTEFYV